MKNIIFVLIFTIIISSGCRKFLEVDNPRDKAVASYVYNSESSAIAVASGIYFGLQAGIGYLQGPNGFSINLAAAADELEAVTESAQYRFYLNSGGEQYWASIYNDIYKCNAAIEGLESADKLSYIVKNQLLGEMKFTRAFLNFYLVNLFGDVPLMVNTNYAENSRAFRSPTAKIYDQIKVDLQESISLLNANYVSSDVKTATVDRIRPNKAAAQALLARVYLYNKEWSSAENMASQVINNPAYTISSDLDAVFLKNSQEAIWQLPTQGTNRDNGLLLNTIDASYLILDESPERDRRPVWLSTYLKSAFEAGDNRFEKWVGKSNFDGIDYLYPHKYKLSRPGQPQQEYLMVLRLAEQYLIRAEARINNGNIPGGVEELNLLRSKRTFGTLGEQGALSILSSSLNLEQARLAVEHERRIELFSELGHRWLDLKRTGRVDVVMSTLNPAKSEVPWRSYAKLFSTPEADRQLNKNLGQTSGWPQ